MILSICDNPSVLEVMKIIKLVITIIKIVVPIILIVVTMIEYTKAIVSSDADSLSKSNKILIKRAIAALLIFFVPTFVNLIAKSTSSNLEYSRCITNATDEKILDLHKNRMDELLAQAEEQKDDISYFQATNYLDNIKDEELAKTYQEKLKEIKAEIDETNKKSNTNIVFPEGSLGTTQASEFYELGTRAYNGDKAAQEEWIEKVAVIVQRANRYKIKNSLIIAQIIQECGWMRTPTKFNSDGSSLVGDNNVLSVNYDMGKKISSQTSAWSKDPQYRLYTVSQWNASKTEIVYGEEKMRKYASIEDCIEDYANIAYLYHNNFENNNNINDYCSFLNGYTPPPAGQDTCVNYANRIQKYNLERFDF